MTLTTFPFNRWLDLPTYRGQRRERYRFEWVDGVSGEIKGSVHPIRDAPAPTLAHNTTQGIKRRLALTLGVNETAEIDPIRDRILPFMDVGTETWPLGRYMFTDDTRLVSTGGDHGSFVLLDEGFAIDQQITTSYASVKAVSDAIIDLITQVSFISVSLDPTVYIATGAWNVGTTRGEILDAYATQGDYFSYWMNHLGLLRMIRVFDPAQQIADIDYDENPRIRAGSIARTSDVLDAPNRFVVISNGASALLDPVVGSYDVPASAPHSIAKRGFVIQQTDRIQMDDPIQVQAAARNIGIRQTVYERVSFTTPNDPRHDSYTVIRYTSANWLELAWTMTLVAGGSMQHTVRKAYS